MGDMEGPEGPGTLDRRTMLRRAAVTGGALIWAAPVVQTLASPAFAAGSPLCETRVETDDCVITYVDSEDCCECLEDNASLPLAEALALCASQGICEEQLRVCGKEEEPPPDEPPPNQPPPNQPPPGGAQGGDDDVDVPTVVPAGQ